MCCLQTSQNILRVWFQTTSPSQVARCTILCDKVMYQFLNILSVWMEPEGIEIGDIFSIVGYHIFEMVAWWFCDTNQTDNSPLERERYQCLVYEEATITACWKQGQISQILSVTSTIQPLLSGRIWDKVKVA